MANFNMDQGAGGGEGPWLAWSAKGTDDGKVDPRNFYIREGDGKTQFDGFKSGVVLDIANMKTGWQKGEGAKGVAPEWKWNPSISQMAAKPGDDYKKGFSIRCAVGGGKTANWEQAAVGSWNAFTALIPALQAGPGDGSLPLVRMTGHKMEQFAKGSTATPVLEVVKWVPRPDCLKEGFTVAQEDSKPAAEQAVGTQAAAAATVPADAEF